MAWLKRGLIFRPDGRAPWLASHAATPVALALGEGRYRTYFSSRDERNRSHVGFFEWHVDDPASTIRVSQQPALAPGPLGHFDDHGVYGTSLVAADGRLLLYYIGWNPGPPPLYYPSIGLAESDDGGETFERVAAAPILARSEHDPWMVSAPFVLFDEGRWRMWYISGRGWDERGGELVSYYDIKYAESDDGVHWRRDGHVALALEPDERNIARACVVKRDGGYAAWYSSNRGGGYRIGYAESPDGYAWARHDDAAGIAPSADGWDSEALAYPFVFHHQDRELMLYNGNGFGRDGIGLAERPLC